MKTNNTITENLQTAVLLFFVPIIIAGLFSLVYAILTGAVDTNLL